MFNTSFKKLFIGIKDTRIRLRNESGIFFHMWRWEKHIPRNKIFENVVYLIIKHFMN